jgi:hypothetical protein
MSFGEFIFSTGFTQKTGKKNLNIERYRGIICGVYTERFQRTPEESTPRQGSRAC